MYFPSTLYYLRIGLTAGQIALRPFFLRAASTFRPPTVAELTRKPDTRARFLRVPPSVQPRPFFLLHSMTKGRRIPDIARRTGSNTISACPQKCILGEKIDHRYNAPSSSRKLEIYSDYITILSKHHSRVKEAQRPLRDATGLRNSVCSWAGRDALRGAFAKAVRGMVTLAVLATVAWNAAVLTAILYPFLPNYRLAEREAMTALAAADSSNLYMNN